MRPTTLLRAGLAALATLAFSSTAHATWPPDASLGGVPVSALPTGEQMSCIASDGAGGCFIAWMDNRSGSNNDIYAQRLDAQGVPLWGASGVAVCTQGASQTEPKIIRSGIGEAIIVWKDNRSGSDDLYAQRIDASGARQWNLTGLAVCVAAGIQDSHVLVDDGSSGAVIAWRDARSADTDIYAQHILFNGAAAWTVNGIGICTATADQSQPALAASGSGQFFLAWSDRRTEVSTNVDIYWQRVDQAGARFWLGDGASVVTAAGQQSSPQLASDALGGVYVVWNDGRGPNYDIYAQHYLASGSDALTTNGLPICVASGDQLAPQVTADGSGGAIMIWQDGRSGASEDIYAAHLTAGGVPNWTANGTPLCTDASNQFTPLIGQDGAGGAVVFWADARGGSSDVYAQRVSRSGSPMWTTNGIAVSSAPGNKTWLSVLVNTDGSAVATWSDTRRAGLNDVYAQRVDRYGYLGSPEPQITQVRDVAGDQGGFTKVTWSASYLDADPTYGISEYRVFRSAPVSLAQAAAAHRALTHDSDVAVDTGALLVLPNAAADIGWEYVGTQAAEAFTSYSRAVATTGDSTGTGNKRTYFLVEARSGTSPASPRWTSLPDSGYSVDNLAPAAPAALTGQYASGTTHLSWQPNAEADLDHYVIYRGPSAAFTPSPANRVTLATAPGFADAAGAPYVYKVTAVDVHGNESPVATLIPSGTLGVGDGAASATLEFAAPQPNPARGTTTLRFSLTQRGPVKLALYDAAGRLVATVADGVMEAGMHSAPLRLRDAAGRELPSGLYLARLEAEGRTLTRRIASIR